MTPKRWTELFFMDEATAFAAGHRPCAECRREDFNKFKSFWLAGNRGFGFNNKTSIKDVDAILHKERIDAAASKVTYDERLDKLPDGAFVLTGGEPHVLYKAQLYQWSPFGYGQPVNLPQKGTVQVLTPKSVINTFQAGYIPQMSV